MKMKCLYLFSFVEQKTMHVRYCLVLFSIGLTQFSGKFEDAICGINGAKDIKVAKFILRHL